MQYSKARNDYLTGRGKDQRVSTLFPPLHLSRRWPLLLVPLSLAACGESRPVAPTGKEPSVKIQKMAKDERQNEGIAQPNPVSLRRTNQDTNLKALQGYVGKNLQALSEQEISAFQVIITQLVPNRNYREYFDYHPWRIWRFQEKQQATLYVLLDVDNTGPHPGSTGIRVTMLDNRGKMLTETIFKTGWRCYLRGVSLLESAEEDYPLIVLETDSWLGPDYAKQIYAKIGAHFDLVRVENSTGQATRNRYYVRHFQCGPLIPQQSESAWETDLKSEERFRVLRALIWLGGVHSDLPVDQTKEEAEKQEEALLVREMLKQKKVQDILQKCAASKDPWIKEAARLALNPKSSHFKGWGGKKGGRTEWRWLKAQLLMKQGVANILPRQKKGKKGQH